MKATKTTGFQRPDHWSQMELAICSKLLAGDILYGDLDDLFIDRFSTRRLVVARPSEERIFLVWSSMAPEDEKPEESNEILITSGSGLEEVEIGQKWGLLDRRIAMKAAEDAVDGAIKHSWLRVWGEGHVHLVARVSRPGLHDSLQTISVTRPEGSFFRKSARARVNGFRPIPKLFHASGAATVFGVKETKGGVRIA
ncbi:hypothetical protein D3C71_174600 [compost metagenome]